MTTLTIFVVLSIAVPMSPTIIALCRRHARAGTILFLNILFSIILGIPVAIFSGGLGLLVLAPFWFWIFIWAVMGEKRQLSVPDFLQNARVIQ
jgi:hypothetical protein